ncbi:uncharacterized protein PAC_12439 [Phialocephala subalpina]|uniref:Uncharacterized protein n=1 Tax=Phialocephala subalpina TaxID=576137 RepID=A0A1L7XBZ6_9HELO|nr:uncharacterized protein PAC_12439 [Phialocephala subalpina]
MSLSESHHDAKETLSRIPIAGEEVLFPEELFRKEPLQDEPPEKIPLLKIPIDLRYMIYDEFLPGLRTINIHETYAIPGECSRTDILGRLSQAFPLLALEIENWRLSRPNLQRLKSGEIFDPAKTTFLMNFVRHSDWDPMLYLIGKQVNRERRWQGIREALSDPGFKNNARHLIIDVSRFECESATTSYLESVLEMLGKKPNKLQNLERLDLFDKPEDYQHNLTCSLCFTRVNWYSAKLWHMVFRILKSCGPNIPCTCCQVFELRYGTERGNGSEERVKVAILPQWARDGIQLGLDEIREP